MADIIPRFLMIVASGDGAHSYTYDAENRLATVDGAAAPLRTSTMPKDAPFARQLPREARTTCMT